MGCMARCFIMPRLPVNVTDPTGYLEEKKLGFDLLQRLVHLRVFKDPWYGFCLEYPLINTKGQTCGSERIYPRGVLHRRCPDRFGEKRQQESHQRLQSV